MKIIIALNHPAHYYLFKFIAKGLVRENHEVRFVIREKDVLEKLLVSEKVPYTKLSEKNSQTQKKVAIIFNGIMKFVKQDVNLFRYVKKFHPNVMMGTDIAITHVGVLLKIPSFVFNEDDFDINKIFCKASYPFATHIISPSYTNVGKYYQKKIAYNGIQKMAYLNSKYFKPNELVLKELGLSVFDPYFIIRMVSLTAGHDIDGNHKGITGNLLDRIIKYLEPRGRVFITSEIGLEEQYKKYHIKLEPNRIHDLMAFAHLFIGDSQTMCAEAGILGTPFIRFNDFVGKIEYLNDIENKYRLGFGIKTNEEEKLFQKLDELFAIPDIKEVWKARKQALFADKMDLTSFIIWFTNTYPESVKILKENPDYLNNFK